MKLNLKRWMLSAALAAVSIGAAQAADGGGSIGDLPGYGADTYFAEGAAYDAPAAAAQTPAVAPVSATSQVASGPIANGPVTSGPVNSGPVASGSIRDAVVGSGYYQPVAAGALQPVGFLSAASSCDAGCDDAMMCGPMGGCDSMGIGLTDPCSGNTWANFEALLWFIEDREVPALITSAPVGVSPNLPTGDARGVEVLFGGQIDSGLAAGFRADAGMYIADNIGIGGRFWQVFDGAEEYEVSGDGTGRTIARPFFDTATGLESALLIAADGVPLNDDFDGSARVESEVELWAAEAYARIRFSGGKHHSLDMIGGYTHLELDDYLLIESRSINQQGGLAINPDGTIREFRDVFDTQNRFDGGQIGFETALTRGKWKVTSLTKVHLGNMNQRAEISGFRRRVTPTPSLDEEARGFLATDGQGVFERDEFAFIPEANFKLAYAFRPNVSLSVGYSFLYIDNVLTVGDLIDTRVDAEEFAFTGNGGPNPVMDFASLNSSSVYVQGIDLGLTIDF